MRFPRSSNHVERNVAGLWRRVDRCPLRPPQHHAHGALYRAALRPLRWVLEGLRERISDETDATGERRVGRGCRKRACASSGRPRAPPTPIGCSAIWPADYTFSLPMLTPWATLTLLPRIQTTPRRTFS